MYQNVNFLSFFLFFFVVFSHPIFAANDALLQIRNSIFKINVTRQVADFENPWHQQPTSGASGSGFYIGDGHIITNAHVVSSARFVTVRRDGDAHEEPAKILFVAHDFDLAVLEVENNTYFQSSKALPLGELPELHSPVTVLGYPIGGDLLSITQGVVSRIEYRSYSSGSNHLAVQIDAAVNAGNSGGPVLQAGKVVGVAFLGIDSASNISYMIPTSVVRHVLKDFLDGTYDGHVDDGLSFKPLVLSHEGTRAFYKLPQGIGGILVSHIAAYSPAFGKLQEKDILLSIDQQLIGEDGLVRYGKERVDFRTIFDLKQVGETVNFGVLRDGKKQTVPVRIVKNKPHPTDEPLHVKRAKYAMFGGLVFMELSRNYLETFGRNFWALAPIGMRYFYAYDEFLPELADSQEIVILTAQLPSSIQPDPEMRLPKLVKSVDGIFVKDLAHMTKLLHEGKSEAILIQFWNEEAPVVLSRADIERENAHIAQHYSIEPSEWLETTIAEDAAMVRNSLPRSKQ